MTGLMDLLIPSKCVEYASHKGAVASKSETKVVGSLFQPNDAFTWSTLVSFFVAG